jgi:NitT/TauT family transport system substrate-binding protein
VKWLGGDCAVQAEIAEDLMQIMQSRRNFLAGMSAAGMAGVLGGRTSVADEGPLETTTLRLFGNASICQAPAYIAEDLLRAEGFTDVRYVRDLPVDAVARGVIDFGFKTPGWIVARVDAGRPVAALAGVHLGCYELFAREPVRTISDLKGRKVGIPEGYGSSGHQLLAIMVAHVGLDPHRDIDWTVASTGNLLEMFVEGQVEAFLAFPPEPQELRARKIGRAILNTTTDRPWSQYFCCMVVGNREFVRAHPGATKRVLRAILKANDICAAEPQRSAQRLVDGGFAKRYDYALQTLTELPYASWRELDPEDAMRFYALRLHEVGMIKSTPNELIAKGTDWRFLNELKRELKA